MRPLLLAGLSLLALTMSRPAHAWWAAGHMAAAGVAYDHLTPKTKAAVDALLMRHKDYGKWMAAMPASYKDRGRWAFLKASAWPDDVRKTPDDRPLWHYVDVPVVAPGYKPNMAEIQPIKPNAETQLPVETKPLTDRSAPDADRAVALCWVEHLVGDIHQPLHAASLFTPLFPKGDKGGNSDLLTPEATAGDPAEAQAHVKNLHALWDGLFGDSQDPAAADPIAARLEGPAFAPRTFPQIKSHRSVHDWVMESNALARDAYLGGSLPLKADGDRADATLPADYLPKAHAVADRQVALAGLRLADLLNAQRFPPVTAAPTPLAAPSQTPPAATKGPIIGNKRSHAYHLPGDTGTLPSEENRVYFQTEAEAQAAGYHHADGGPTTPKP